MPRPKKNTKPKGNYGKNSDDFYEMLRAYPDQSGTALYLYRIFPQIRRSPKYIDKIKEPYPADNDWIVKKWGGGLYQQRFVDTNGPSREQKQVAICTVEIDSIEHEPILDFRELALDTSNEPQHRYIERMIAQGKITPQGEPIMSNIDRGTDGKILEFAQEQIAAARRDAAPRADGAEQHAAIKVADAFGEIIKKMGTGQQQPDNSATVAIAALGQMLQAQQAANAALMQQNADLMIKMMERSNAPAANSITDMTTALGALADLQQKLGGNGGAAHWWEPLLTGLGPALGPVIIQMLQKQSATPAAPGAPFIPRPALYQSNNAPTEARPIADTPQPAVQPQLYALAQQMLKCMNGDFSGNDLAHSIMVQQGRAVYDGFHNLGREQIIAVMLAMPEIGPVLETLRPQLEAFVNDFMDYGKEEEPDAPAIAGSAPRAA
ncbi:hypothetical protein EPO44_10330 [bacterium]|nr:MAG: hypothetical protein EPO44_10330 [bacterium]